MALIIIGLLAAGLYMTDMDKSDLKWQIYGLHKSFGILVLFLIAIRLSWKAIDKAPVALSTYKKAERILSKLLQHFFLAAMVLMPVSGWLMSSAGGHSIKFFGLFEVPALIEKNKDIGGLMHEVHEYLGWAMIVALVLHISGALKHHFVTKDITLSRMMFFSSKNKEKSK